MQFESKSSKKEHPIMLIAIKPMQNKKSKKQIIIEESKRTKKKKKKPLISKKQVDPNFQKISKTISE